MAGAVLCRKLVGMELAQSGAEAVASLSDPNWWAAFASIAGAIIAAIAAFVTIWWPWFSRPGVKWVPERVLTDPQMRMNNEPLTLMQVSFMQVGDGIAYDIRVESETSHAGILSEMHVAHRLGDEKQAGPVESLGVLPVARTGDKMVVALHLDDAPLDEQTFAITWNQPPVRRPWVSKRIRARFSGQECLDQTPVSRRA